MPLLIMFIAIPIIEIGLFIQVGGWIGLWKTLAIVVLTAVIGTALLRAQGMAALARLQANVNSGQNPMDPIVNGALILVAGILLLTPGFFTDAIGFCLLIPPIRSLVIKWGAARMMRGNTFVFTSQGTKTPRDPSSLEGDFVVLDEDDTKPDGNAGRTKPE
jgi:UPF0716 protein FxsA